MKSIMNTWLCMKNDPVRELAAEWLWDNGYSSSIIEAEVGLHFLKTGHQLNFIPSSVKKGAGSPKGSGLDLEPG